MTIGYRPGVPGHATSRGRVGDEPDVFLFPPLYSTDASTELQQTVEAQFGIDIRMVVHLKHIQLDRLPAELLVEILQHLDVRDVLRCRLVRSLHRVESTGFLRES